MSGPDDGGLHPIETIRDTAELLRVLDRLATALESESERRSDAQALLRGQWVNDVLFSGAVDLVADGAATATLSVQAPFAAVTIEDANELGPLLVEVGTSGSTNQRRGPGKWTVPRGGRRTIAMTGTSLSITGLALPPYRQVLAGPVFRWANSSAVGATVIAPAPATGSIRVRAGWLVAQGGTAGELTSSDLSVRVLDMPYVGGAIESSWEPRDGAVLPAATSLVLQNYATSSASAGAVYDVVATTGPALVYVTLHTRPVEASS